MMQQRLALPRCGHQGLGFLHGLDEFVLYALNNPWAVVAFAGVPRASSGTGS
jgi:hypothetical protein